ncbi:MAG TPA: FAD-dependent oxidoreductase, partial [Thermoleophilia bacterium]|nr:FAD-dependent oxidoreductase [Thermoleophilia bacterium]
TTMAVSKIDLDKCIGCATCVVSCPMDVFRLDTAVEYRQESSPCGLACPLGIRQREYHHLVRTDRLDEAAEVMRLSHPMPAITGRLCPHPCEAECTRNLVDKPVNINALEAFVGDYLLALGPPHAQLPVAEGKVAVLGSGPAGLAAAYFLALGGHLATIFEKEHRPGGILRSAVPRFRLPDRVLDRQIEFYEEMGVEFRTGVRVGADITMDGLRDQGYRAFVAATGATKPMGLQAAGSDAKGIVTAIDFLGAVKRGGMPNFSGPVAVIGGGSVALDAARTAVRLGARVVNVVCLECREPGLKDSMLVTASEIDSSLAEGVFIHASRGVHSFVVTNGQVRALRCVDCLSVRDDAGRFRPLLGDCVLPDEIEAEMVILATGQWADPELVPAGFRLNERGLISADCTTQWVVADLFAAGDAVTGPSTIVEALAAGKRAARAVERYFAGEDLSGDLESRPPRTGELPAGRILSTERLERREVPNVERTRDFREVSLCFGDQEARMEAERCLTCGSRSVIAYLDDCQVCRLCQHYCPTEAIEVTDGALLGSLHGWDVVGLGERGAGAPWK